jgi:hypothetical protein
MTKKKFIKYTTATKCHVHLAIADAAVKLLSKDGFFSKEEVLRVTGYALFEESVYWDHIRRMIEEQHKTDLMPLAQAFFNRKRKDPTPIENPGRYMAGGTGKKTAGFAIVSEDNGSFVRWSLEHARRCVEGKAAEYATRRSVADQVGIPNISPALVLRAPDAQS